VRKRERRLGITEESRTAERYREIGAMKKSRKQFQALSQDPWEKEKKLKMLLQGKPDVPAADRQFQLQDKSITPKGLKSSVGIR
jgi:hypothetical protein